MKFLAVSTLASLFVACAAAPHTPRLGPAAGATVTLTDLIAVPLEAL